MKNWILKAITSSPAMSDWFLQQLTGNLKHVCRELDVSKNYIMIVPRYGQEISNGLSEYFGDSAPNIMVFESEDGVTLLEIVSKSNKE